MISAALAMMLSHRIPSSSEVVAGIVKAAWQQAAKAVPPTKEELEAKRHGEEIEGDKALGKKYSLEVAKELDIVDDPANQMRVDRIGHELANIANSNQVVALWGDKRLSPFDYTFKIVTDKDKKHPDDVNAFSLPGGYIYVYKGLLKFAESDDELAGVLAHEIAHAAFRHVATLQHEQSKLNAIQIPLVLIAIFTGGASGAASGLGLSSLLGTAIGSGWSVRAEEAADYGGFQYLTKSKYDPTGMLTFMERLARKDLTEPLGYELGIYRTHPPSRDRANALIGYMKADNLPIRRSRVAQSFRVVAKPADNGTVQLTLGRRAIVSLAGDDALVRADQAVQKLNEFFDSVPEAFEVQPGSNGDLLARQEPLFALSQADATANKATLLELQRSTVSHIRAALFSIGYRVWDIR